MESEAMKLFTAMCLFVFGAVLSITETKILGASVVGSAIALLYAKELTWKKGITIFVTATALNYYSLVPLVIELGYSLTWITLIAVLLSGVWHHFIPTLYILIQVRMKAFLEKTLDIINNILSQKK